MDKRTESKPPSKPAECLRCGGFSTTGGTVTSTRAMIRSSSVLMNSGKLRNSVIRERECQENVEEQKRCKPNVISGDTSADNLMSLIDYSKLFKVSALC